MKALKKQLFDACTQYVELRAKTVNDIITSNQKALSSETKSSAGDKHETGRAMLQLEMEKAGQQLAGINQMKTVLAKIKFDEHTETVKLGSIIVTKQANYFLAISVGELKVLDKIFYAVSPKSPIGQLLLGKKVGEIFTFNKQVEIVKIY